VGELDEKQCVQILLSMVVEEGKEVYSIEWDSGGGGGGPDWVAEFGGYYWARTDMGIEGPYDSAEEALSESNMLMITDATGSIKTSLWPTEELAKQLKIVEDVDMEDHEIDINGEPWRIRQGKLEFKGNDEWKETES
jgi:hypothetical protein